MLCKTMENILYFLKQWISKGVDQGIVLIGYHRFYWVPPPCCCENHKKRSIFASVLEFLSNRKSTSFCDSYSNMGVVPNKNGGTRLKRYLALLVIHLIFQTTLNLVQNLYNNLRKKLNFFPEIKIFSFWQPEPFLLLFR